MARWDHEADVVVVGAGGAALAAAASAAQAGASVIVLEAADEPGGTTKRSGGAFWIPNNSFLRAAGVTDPREDALKLMAHLAHPSIYDPDAPRFGLSQHAFDLLATYYDRGSDVIDALVRLGALDPMILPPLGFGPSPLSDPDYHAELPENKAPFGRVLTAKTPPGAMVWPGVPLIEGLVAHVRSKGIPILVDHRVTGALTNGRGEVTGVEAEHAGQTRSVRARRGVVFATGGFAHDAGKTLSFLRGPVFGAGSVPAGNGAFLDIAGRLGAAMGNLANGFYFQVAVEAAIESAGAVARPDAFVWLPYGDSTILVDKRGKRIVNEKAMYHERTQSHFVYTNDEYPNLVEILIWDDAVAQEPTFWPWRGATPMPGQTSPFVIRGETIDELSAAIAQRLASLRGGRGLTATIGPDVRLAPDFATTLKATIERFNGFAQTGKDLDFHRGETPIEPAWQGPSRGSPNRTMTAFSPTGPYYAMLVGAAVLDTCGGPVIGTSGQVLRQDGSAIQGLYGAGNCIASPGGQGYFGAGGTIGPALVFGFLAGEHAARAPARHD